ncbi:hypothetical protein TVAG_382010 [Trichomonas vaginalis G3]|uniref:MHD domain-containing protein n=1 Tax=Trichomonas vaginalis (strain ATCC PRA-98 / G3) TaxID=412133 RepID=A2F2A4_TRIV3|nr:vesicle-mediated transport [Trichomonas vaginalis G3]EAY00983.1 hypothetical protein TVAG_382010 [Trichomonas vaginalis G3]KAI5516789.1 vesicle-mediated transport [Trichomonas vaginalis G3]|eukprot:XP_001330054.1 hypothetical protein [Trichomonas vaginalis G3]
MKPLRNKKYKSAVMSQSFAFRGLFIFDSSGKIAIAQRFKTVEMRVPTSSAALPSNDQLSKIFQEKVLSTINSESNYEFIIDNLISLVVLPTKNFFITLIPLILSKEDSNMPHVEIAASFHFLSFLEPVLRTSLKTLATNPNPAAVFQLINLIMPFGSPIIHDPYFVSQLPITADSHLFNAGYATVSPAPVPSWKTYLVFPRQHLEIKMRETIVGSIDGDKQYYGVFGELRCIASINYLPEISIAIKNFEKLQEIACHYSVKSIESGKLLLSPPTGITQLLLWQFKSQDPPPITGSYTASAAPDNGVSFSITVTAIPSVKSVSVQIPFPDRGALTKHQFQTPPNSQIKMSKREATIAWTVEVDGSSTLSGVLNFERESKSQERLKAFIEFKSKNSTYSGASIDDSSVVIPTAGTTVVIENSYSTESKKYIIWGPAVTSN